ncbi:MAG: hypothetical protein OXN17_00555 [Candidatus Poribacteria bacterium]|nr:hypothetical protein [Candidatus Poribacteria bacterium]
MDKYAGRETARTPIGRALILGSVLIAVSAYWVVGVENRIIWEITDFSIFPTVIFVLFLLALLNLILVRYFNRFSLKPSELAIIYIMLCIATSLFGHDMMRQLIPMMTNPFWFATPENEWEQLFFRYIPRWLTVDNRASLHEYYTGQEDFFTPRNMGAWILPALAWTGFLFVFLFKILCINIIVRKQWTEHERLSFPIIRLPLELASNPKIFSKKLMWIGFGAALVIELLAGLDYLYPIVPSLRIKMNIRQYFASKPWNAVGDFHFNIYAFVMGLAYFTPLSLSFSLWFFHLFWKLLPVAYSALGWRTGEGGQIPQRFGAWIGIGVLALFTSRHHIKDTIVKFFTGQNEGNLYRLAYSGLVLSIILIMAFWYLAGSSPWMVALYFSLYTTLCIAVTRMRSELGPPTHELHGASPDGMMVAVAGSKAVGAANLTNFTLLEWMPYAYRCHPMPHQLEGFKMSERLRMKDSAVVIAILLAALLGSIASFAAHLGFYYKYPNYAIWGVHPFNRLGSWLSNPVSGNFASVKQMGFGFVFTIFLMVMSRRYLWWQFHPVGYAVGVGWAIGHMWFSVFVSWFIKMLIMMYGGRSAYRAAIPVFLGLILGQFFMGSLWSLIGLVLNRNMYTLFP